MIQLLICLPVTAAAVKDVIDALRSVMLTARLDRACARARILVDADAPQSVWYVEEWCCRDSLEQRIRSEPFAQLVALMEAVTCPPSMEFRTVSDVQGLEYAESVKGKSA